MQSKFLVFELEGPKIQAGSAANIVLRLKNVLDTPITNLSFELASNGVRISGVPQQNALSIAAGGVLRLTIALRGAMGDAAIIVRGISFRANGKTSRPPDLSLPIEVEVKEDAEWHLRTISPDKANAPPSYARMPPTDAGYWEQAVWWTQNPPEALPGRGDRVFVSYAGDLSRKAREYGVDWVRELENALKRPLADLSRKLKLAGREGKCISAFIYSSPTQGLKPGVEALSDLVKKMYSAPAAILLLSHEYPARDPTWCFEAPFLMWRHQTDGMPLFLVRATATGDNKLRYPAPEGERQANLLSWTCDRFGHPDILHHPDSNSLQKLKDTGHLDDALLRLNGVASALVDALAQRLR